MIHVSVRQDRIMISGHAGYAPSGHDIVCAAVSALTLTLVQGLEQIAGMEIRSREEPGSLCIEWQYLNNTGKALIDTWFLGLCHINAQYNCIQYG